ncbi:GNAT family N-acetyltransferase [Nocardia wallacei]|uniref:GNAT family N-acetyltransferase n=1 Tax=Nocardia wallacei TaxID=480035 RepID=UPI002458D3D3|nr:GNAT family N-acetyltransferase [Nocardia wallacei]
MAGHLADTLGGDRIGARAVEATGRAYADTDRANAALLERLTGSSGPPGKEEVAKEFAFPEGRRGYGAEPQRGEQGQEVLSNPRAGNPVPQNPHFEHLQALAEAQGVKLAASEVRRLAPDDWPVNQYLAIRNAGRDPLDFSATLAKVERQTEQDYRQHFDELETFAAFYGELPVGRVRLLAGSDPHVLTLAAMIVDPVARGTGTGDRLVQIALDWARAHDCRSVELWVRSNNEPANNLYLRNGFRPTGETKPSRFVGAPPSIEMTHDLS